jgi:hypothetical protein
MCPQFKHRAQVFGMPSYLTATVQAPPSNAECLNCSFCLLVQTFSAIFTCLLPLFINENKTACVDASKFIEGIQWLLEDGFSRLGAIQVGVYHQDFSSITICGETLFMIWKSAFFLQLICLNLKPPS